MSIKKISEITGASPSTISRVLNNPNHKCIDKNIRTKIFEAARKLNYVPNDNARRLKLGFANTKEINYINVLLTRNQSDPFFSELLRIIEVFAHNNMFVISHIWHNCMFSDFQKCKTENIKQIVKDMFAKETKSNGLLILGKIDKEVVNELKLYNKNIVSISRNYENLGIDELICDGNKNTKIAVDHLIKLGHKKIAYVGCCENESRYEGYQKALFQYNIMPNIRYVFECEAEFQKGIEALGYFSKLGDPPTAIYCSNDILALGIIKAAYRYAGRRYFPSYHPAIVSSDDIEEAQQSNPMLTTIRLPKDEMVKFAFILLRDKILGGHNTSLKMEFEGDLIVRESAKNINSMLECEYYI